MIEEEYDFEWKTGWFNYSTEFSGSAKNGQKVSKEVCYLPRADATLKMKVKLSTKEIIGISGVKPKETEEDE